MPVLGRAEIFSVVGTISGDESQTGYVIRFDAIEHEGRVWLVPEWLLSPDEKHRVPERIVAPPPYLLVAGDGPDNVRYSLRDPVPKSALDGHASRQSGYTVVERPDIRVELSTH